MWFCFVVVGEWKGGTVGLLYLKTKQWGTCLSSSPTPYPPIFYGPVYTHSVFAKKKMNFCEKKKERGFANRIA